MKMAALKVPKRTSDFATRQHAETLESHRDFREVLRIEYFVTVRSMVSEVSAVLRQSSLLAP